MQRKIEKHFTNSKNTTLVVPHSKDDNILYDWPRVRSPFKVIINYLVIKLCMIASIKLKIFLLKNVAGIKIGKNVAIAPEVEFDPFHPELIEIGDNSVIGMDCYILTHEFTPDSFKFSRVRIGKNVMISAFCTLRCGVTIGDGSQVAMCSFVNKDIPSGELWGGVPAKFIKKLHATPKRKTRGQKKPD